MESTQPAEPPLESEQVPLVKNIDAKSSLLKKTSTHFTDIMHLGVKNPTSAMMVMRYSDDVVDLADNAKLVAQLGDDAVGILANGNKTALTTAKFFQKSGDLTGLAVKKAMIFGEASLSLVRKLPLTDIILKVRMIRTTLSGKLWYYTLWMLSLIPLPIAIGLGTYASLILYKMWFIPVTPRKKKLAHA